MSSGMVSSSPLSTGLTALDEFLGVLSVECSLYNTKRAKKNVYQEGTQSITQLLIITQTRYVLQKEQKQLFTMKAHRASKSGDI